MSWSKDPDAEPTPEEIRLSELVEGFEARRAADSSIGIGSMRAEAADCFPELQELAECMGVLRRSFGEDRDEIPAEFAAYTIEAKLGEGVSGVVYRARGSDGEVVALKVMHQTLALSNEAMERFRREIAIAQKLRHDHVVAIRDHGEHEGRLYLAMELIDGATMSQVLKPIESSRPDESWIKVLDDAGIPPVEGAASPGEEYARRIAGLFAGPARALALAARVGLVHRDLKPSNLLLRKEGTLVVADFGLARVVGEDITSTIAVLGTPAYMSPEQAAGDSRNADARSDIYGLGASLYYALTRRYPLDGCSFSDILAAIIRKPPEPITKFCGDYPSSLSKVVSRCLEKERIDRYQDGEMLAIDLARVAAGKRPKVGTVPVSRRARRFLARHRPVLATAGAAALVIVLGVGWWFTRPATLMVASIPPGMLEINGEKKGETDWSDSVSRGECRVRITRERFVPYDQTIQLEPGAQRTLSVPLRPIDPFDVVALRLVARYIGFDAALPSGSVARPRGVNEQPFFLPTRPVLVRKGAEVLVVHAERAGPVELTVNDLPATKVALEAGLSFVQLSGLQTGNNRIRFTAGGETLQATVELVAPEVAALEESLNETDYGEVLHANQLVAARLCSEALRELQPILERHPRRSLPARIALEAVNHLGLRGSPLYQQLFATYNEAQEIGK